MPGFELNLKSGRDKVLTFLFLVSRMNPPPFHTDARVGYNLGPEGPEPYDEAYLQACLRHEAHSELVNNVMRIYRTKRFYRPEMQRALARYHNKLMHIKDHYRMEIEARVHLPQMPIPEVNPNFIPQPPILHTTTLQSPISIPQPPVPLSDSEVEEVPVPPVSSPSIIQLVLIPKRKRILMKRKKTLMRKSWKSGVQYIHM
ncbi:hypothetical protein ACFX11_000218 [Malus domestica]